MNLFSVLDERVDCRPDGLALADHRRRLTFRELRKAAEDLAAELRRAGVQPSDKVGLLFFRGVEEIIAAFALARLGAVAVQLSAALKPAEIARLDETLSLDAVLHDPDLASLIPQAGFAPKDLPFGSLPVSLQRSTAAGTPPQERELLDARHAAAIGFSSGTTSDSKAILLSHEALFARARMEADAFGIAEREATLYLLSITYAFAPPALAALCRGAALLIGDAGVPECLHRIVAEHHPAVVYAAPLNYRMLLDDAAMVDAGLRSARFLVSTGSRLPDALLEDYRRRVGRDMVNRYGLNECGMVCANFSGSPGKRGSIGPAAGAEIMLFGDGVDFPRGGSSGELLVRGKGLFEGYCNPWRPREEFSIDGWFRTGDLAQRDADGYYWITGRTKEMINVGGLKVVPAEIEEVLTDHPEVEEAVVFGVADARFGEVPCAKVKLIAGSRLDEAALLRYVKPRVAFYKSPRAIEIVEHLPKTASGKIRRARAG